ncbi:MAG: hypothetical protein F6K47_33960 [Symploca sp. SIO2E6]|nr:hypothetical protein [Symploca sp. SIO2E6]
MAEPWTALGVYLFKELVLKEVLLELGKGALEDYVKDFFKDCIKVGVTSAEPKVWQKALGEAIQQFLKIVETELEYICALSGAQIRDNYEIPVGKFIKNRAVKPLLGQAFAKDCLALEGGKLEAIWQQQHLPTMPADFDWHRVAKLYVNKVKQIIQQSPELRGILQLEIIEDLQQDTQLIKEQTREIAGIVPDFNLEAYQEGLQERYAHLNLDSLDTSIYDYREKLKLNSSI